MALQTRSSQRLASLRCHGNGSEESLMIPDEVFGAVGELPPANVAVPVDDHLVVERADYHDQFSDTSSKSLQLLGSNTDMRTPEQTNDISREPVPDAVLASSGPSTGSQQLEPGQLLVPDNVEHVRVLLNKNLNCRGAVKSFVVKRMNELVLQLSSGSCYCCGDDPQFAHKKGRYVCERDSCGKRFLLKSSLQRHVRVMHEAAAEQCDKCEFRCGDRGALARHMFTHTGIRPFSCQKCDKHFTRRFHLERHQKSPACSIQSTDTYHCQVCDKQCSRLDNLREHMKTHTDSEESRRSRPTFDCTQCGKQMASASVLQVHMRSHTGERPFSCDMCEKRFTSWRACVKHRRTHTGDRPFACDQCERRFAAKETLNRHVKTHGNSRPYQCQHCDKRFLQKSQLTSHLFHHTGRGGFACHLCDKSFSRKARLRSHVEFVHEGRKSFSCQQCERQFVRRSDLVRHEVVHTSVKQHRCAVCDKAFALKAALKAHLLTHTKEPPRSCVGCGRAFIRQDCLVRHMRRKHQDVLDDVMAKNENRNHQQKMSLTDEKSPVPSSVGTDDTVCGASLSESTLSASLYELLTLLIDADTLNQLRSQGGAVGVEDLTTAVIERCGHSGHIDMSLSTADRLREKAKRLFTVVIDDPAVQTLLTTHSIDQVIMHVLKLART